MRTTVSIDDALLERAKARAAERGTTLGSLVEESLALLLSAVDAPPGPELPVFEGDTGARPGVDLTSNASMFEAAEGSRAS